MIEKLNSLWTTYNEMLKSNPVIAGAITLYGMGVITYLFRDIPFRIFFYIKSQFVVSVVVQNHDLIFNHLTEWLEKGNRLFRCKSFVAKMIHGIRKNTVAVSVGYGNHIFFYKRRLFYLSRIEKDANATTEVKESIIVNTYGWSPNSIRDMLQSVVPQPSTGATEIYEFDRNYWSRRVEKNKRRLDSVVLTDENESKIKTHIRQYLEDKEWYRKHNIPWRTGIILEGPPGTGKSSTALALCGEFDCNLYIANLSLVNDNTLMNMFSMLPSKAVILIEDIDSYTIATSRKKVSAEKKEKDKPTGLPKAQYDAAPSAMEDFMNFGSLSGLLNAIDGICSSEDRILIATTNHLERLDPALIREGRFELILKIDFLNDETGRKMFSKFYPEFKLPKNFKMKEGISPAKFQTLAMGHKKEPQFVLDYCTGAMDAKQRKKIDEALNEPKI